MAKSSCKTSNQDPISKKVLAGLKKAQTRQVIDFSEFKEAKVHSENLEKRSNHPKKFVKV